MLEKDWGKLPKAARREVKRINDEWCALENPGYDLRAMNSLLKKMLIVGGSLVALVAASGGGVRWWLEGKLSKEAIVAQMESSWNCRAQIESVTLVMMASPARLEVVGCILAPRDAEVSKPLAQRPPMTMGKTGMSIGRAVLELKLQDLLSRRLNVQQLTVSDVIVEEDVPRAGDSSLSILFEKPVNAEAVTVTDAPLPVTSPATPVPVAEASSVVVVAPASGVPAAPVAKLEAPAAIAQEKAVHEPEVFVASQLGFSINVRRASIERGNFHRNDHRNTTKTDVTDLNFSITDIDVNPADLAQHNSLNVTLSGRLKQRGRIGPKDARREVTMAEVVLVGEGTLHPFDIETGLWKPVSDLTLTMKKDSTLGGYMKLGETGSKELKKLDQYGIDLSDLSLGGPLLDDASLRLSFQDDRNTLAADAHFAMPDFELTLHKGSWLNGAEDAHEMQVRITCGPKLQDQVSAGVGKFLGADLGANVIKSLSDERGRVYFDMQSSGRLSKPKVVPDLQRLLNRLLQGGGLLEGLLKK